MREWTSRISGTHYCLGSVMGPYPFPTIVRDFQAVISKEIKEQMLTVNNMAISGKPNDLVINTHVCRGNFLLCLSKIGRC